MFQQVRTRAGKLFLWLAAIAILGFVASLSPELRRVLPWLKHSEVPAERG